MSQPKRRRQNDIYLASPFDESRSGSIELPEIHKKASGHAAIIGANRPHPYQYSHVVTSQALDS